MRDSRYFLLFLILVVAQILLNGKRVMLDGEGYVRFPGMLLIFR